MPELRRELSLFDMTMIAIGSGIFLTPALIAKTLRSPLWILGVWILGGMMALSGALTYAELGGMMPRVRGVHVFLSEACVGVGRTSTRPPGRSVQTRHSNSADRSLRLSTRPRISVPYPDWHSDDH